MPIWRNTTGDGLWGTANNWLADGSGNGVPDATKDATFDASSPSCTVNASARTCKNINFTGYANTLTMSFAITVSGNVTFILSQSNRISGTGALFINANSTITSNGGTWPNGLTFTGAITVTLADNLTVSGALTTQTNTVTVNSNVINVQGNLTISATLTGTATLNINGAGNQIWTGNSALNLTTNINKTSGNLTLTNIVFGSTTLAGTRTLTYVGLGTGSLIATTTSNFFICSIQSNGVNWGNISVPAPTGANPQTITLLDDMYVNNITSGGSANSTFNGFNLYINGNITVNSFGFLGTTVFNVVGTGNQTWSSSTGSSGIDNNLKINKASGNFIISGALGYGYQVGANPLLEHISGAVVTTGSTLFINGNCRIKSNVGNPNAIVFNNLGFANQSYTLTLIDNMTINTFAPNGGGNGGGAINGNTLFINGDITIPTLGTSQFFTGTTVFNISGTGNQTWSSSLAHFLRNNIVINKTSGTLSLSGNIAWGTSGTSLTYIQGTVNSGTSTFTSANGSIFNLNAVGFNLWNWTPSLGTQTINTQPLVVNSILTLNGTITFAGTHGFSTNTLTCLVTGSTITLQNNTASPNATYYISTALNLTGASSASRITLQASGSATFNARAGSPSSNSLQYVSGTVPSVGMTVSQETGQSPVGFSNLLPTRPVINGGTSPNFTLDQTIVPSIPFPPTGTISMRAGYKAIFTLQSGAFQNVAYVTTQDIDSLSNSGATILSFGSNNDDVATNVFLYRTLNWGPLVASSGSAYKTWVD